MLWARLIAYGQGILVSCTGRLHVQSDSMTNPENSTTDVLPVDCESVQRHDAQKSGSSNAQNSKK